MQYVKHYQRHRKTTFQPLVPTASDQNGPLPPVTKRKSFRKRRVAPNPTGSQTEDFVVSAGPSNKQYIGESLPILLEGKRVETLNDGRTESSSSLKSELASRGSPDGREYNTQSPIDPDRFNPRLALHFGSEEDNCDEQSQA